MSLTMVRRFRPGRSYYTLVGSYHEEATAPDFNTPESQAQRELDTQEFRELLGKLPLLQRLHCAATRQIRLLEKQVYDAKVKNMK